MRLAVEAITREDAAGWLAHVGYKDEARKPHPLGRG
jgi:hypothetical protein